MNVLIFGATGMVGQGVLRECLLDPDVAAVQTVGRSATNARHPKLRDLVHQDLWNYASIETSLSNFNACFFCLGVSSGEVTAHDYQRITYDLTLAAAEVLSRLNPGMTFVYVSGAGTDNTENGRVAWARVKGRTENALLRLPFAAAYMFRPGIIQPLHGIASKTRSYRLFYAVAKPVLPLFRVFLPNHIVTTEQLGRAMLTVARRGWPRAVLESRDIRAAAEPMRGTR
jgi:uncharacterized protein YbjT (DUF2867 family)